MSLNWSVGKVKDWEAVCFEPKDNEDGERVMTTRTHTLIHMTMLVDMGQITEQTAAKFFERVNAYERLFGAMRGKSDGSDVFYTFSDIRAHIGLSTNVTTKSDSAWWKRMRENFSRETQASVKAQLKRELLAKLDAASAELREEAKAQ